MHLRNIARLLASTGISCMAICCLAQTVRPDFGRQDAVRRIDSIARQIDVQGSPAASSKRYSELTAEEKASLNQYFENIEPGDEPPYPSEGMKPIYDAIQAGQNKLLVSGELMLKAAVNATGEVTEVKAAGSPSPEMTKFAASVVFLTKFKPAMCQGQPCKMEFPFRFVFRAQ